MCKSNGLHALARSSAYAHDGQSGTGCVPKHCSELVWRVALIHPALRPAHPRRPGGGLPPRPPSSPGAAAAACQRPPDAPQPPPPPGAELGVGDGAGRLPAEEVRAAAADAVGWGRGPPGQPRQCRRSAVDRGGGAVGSPVCASSPAPTTPGPEGPHAWTSSNPPERQPPSRWAPPATYGWKPVPPHAAPPDVPPLEREQEGLETPPSQIWVKSSITLTNSICCTCANALFFESHMLSRAHYCFIITINVSMLHEPFISIFFQIFFLIS